ncbi:MAG: hypothetical protein E7L01_01135 [Paenibacillus macerans]|uniref:Putative membrane protein n=1 Tax=Paenibacillus macerans TaxID=44252 RepID=A0A090XFK4_PAEMA|nr:hypothetical protein [Paenibacillus macerans]KFM83663.1 putative membrane protein [Paenibacillus macerans]MBS5914425.1 hypothetical protein [Paenibacillus macerans]MCY7559665.1 hypothetical protein [Paenibacillus macerans]MDU7471950.1 hypothetical protein [Paenibacillus macerans]MEC0135631.1 hypothetical protein [Paenibacillus macerans]
MDTISAISLLLGIAAFIVFNAVFEVRFFEGTGRFFLGMLDTLAEYLGRYNTKRYVERIKKERIVKRKENIYAKYNRLVEGLILDFNLPLTLESFTSLLCIAFAVMVLVIILFMENVTLSVVITIAIFVGLLTYFTMQSKAIKAEKLESIMDAEDIICPLAREGVLVAIKKVMESDEYIRPSIRPYFQQFIDNCENNGYSFKQAITVLNRQLGPKFDNFTKKAIVFEYNERKGMADIFLDIVDENAVLREINARKDRIFRKMNRDFLLKTAIIVLFFIYALSVKDFREFMLYASYGKVINTVMISIICLSFARTQTLQGDLGIGGELK